MKIDLALVRRILVLDRREIEAVEQLFDEIEQYEAEIEYLRMRVSQLTDALKPFAVAGSDVSEEIPNEEPLAARGMTLSTSNNGKLLRVSHLRNAHALFRSHTQGERHES